tara:strand:+ start:994 stop:1113 length:120 start_codon:yes stop_codon:yes gene_type:complete
MMMKPQLMKKLASSLMKENWDGIQETNISQLHFGDFPKR